MAMQQAVTLPTLEVSWGFESLPTHWRELLVVGCELLVADGEMRRRFQWRNARLQTGKGQVRSLHGVL